MSRSRAERRHHHRRMLDKVKSFFIYQNHFWTEEEKLQHQRKLAETRTPCSCHMCGNPRRMFNEKTMQEIKSMEKMKDEC